MDRDYVQVAWDEAVAEDCRQLVRLAVREDVGRWFDWTTVALVPAEAEGRAAVVSRGDGVMAGLPAAALVCEHYDRRLAWRPAVEEGARVTRGQRVADVVGPARSLLSAERPLLNLLGHAAGVATETRRYVEAVSGTRARIYDTRKTLPAYRLLDKYAVHVGGGRNHRRGLYDGVLIKDNHLAYGDAAGAASRYTPAEALRRARDFLAARAADAAGDADLARLLVEIEVDSLAQLAEVLPAGPDVVLLDNMSPAQLREAVRLRDAQAPGVELEASGGITLETVRAVAETGVERISVGALTHSVRWFDVGLDWE